MKGYCYSTQPNLACFFLVSLILSWCSLLHVCTASPSEVAGISTFLFMFLPTPAILLICLDNKWLQEENCYCDQRADESPFTYKEGTGKGPLEWGKLNPTWRLCETGKYQSPIDLLDQRVQTTPALGELKRDCVPAPAVIKNRGHDIVLLWKGDAGKIEINGTIYKLVQCHWHSPSEHTINGSRYQLELHMVHRSCDGQFAVIGIVFEYGHADPFLSRLLPHIKSAGKQEKHIGIVNPGDITLGCREYYRYIGSLTVPPCTEGVVWTIMQKVRTISREQVIALRDLVHDGFKSNARPTQKLDGRPIWFYNPSESGGSVQVHVN